MTNLATLIGVTNLEALMQEPKNTYVVVNDNGKFVWVKKSNEIDVEGIVGIGSCNACQALAHYLTLQAVAC